MQGKYIVTLLSLFVFSCSASTFLCQLGFLRLVAAIGGRTIILDITFWSIKNLIVSLTRLKVLELAKLTIHAYELNRRGRLGAVTQKLSR